MGKSFLSSIIFPAYLLGRDPSNKIISTTYGFDLSKSFSKELLDIVTSHEYQLIFPHTKFENLGKSSTIWYTEKLGGYYKSTSRGSAITGLSANYIIADDLVKNSTEAKSPSLLKSIKDWWYSTLYSRLTKKSNGEEAKVLILMTRWSKNDLIGEILSKDSNNEWYYLNLPALDENNNPLWEEMQSKKLLLDIKHRDPETFSCLYQGQPGNKGSTEFNLSDYVIYPMSHTFSKKIKYYFSSWDTASKISENNDFTVGTLWSLRDNKLYLEDYIKGKYTLPELHKLIESKHTEWNCKFSLIESASSGIGLLQLLNNKKKFIGIPADVKKKISTAVPLLDSQDVILKNYKELLEELEEYPYGQNDDCVASIVNAIWYYALNLKREINTSLQPKTVIRQRKKIIVP